MFTVSGNIQLCHKNVVPNISKTILRWTWDSILFLGIGGLTIYMEIYSAFLNTRVVVELSWKMILYHKKKKIHADGCHAPGYFLMTAHRKHSASLSYNTFHIDINLMFRCVHLLPRRGDFSLSKIDGDICSPKLQLFCTREMLSAIMQYHCTYCRYSTEAFFISILCYTCNKTFFWLSLKVLCRFF